MLRTGLGWGLGCGEVYYVYERGALVHEDEDEVELRLGYREIVEKKPVKAADVPMSWRFRRTQNHGEPRAAYPHLAQAVNPAEHNSCGNFDDRFRPWGN